MDYVDILRSNTSANREGGIVPELLVAPVSTFTAIQALPGSAPIGDGASLVITGDHTFGASDGFIKLGLSKESLNKLMSDMVGEGDNGGAEIKSEVFVSGFSKALAEFFTNAKWEDWIILVKLPNGTYIQIGSEDFPATISGNFGTGGKGESANGYTVNIRAYNLGPIFYEGVRTLKP